MTTRSITIALLLAVGSVARAEDAPSLRLATFRADVTPPLGAAIYSGYQPLAKIEHPLLAKGVVLDDRGKRYVLCAVDWCELCNSTHTAFRQKIAAAAGTDPSRVAVQTVHQHTAPMGDGDAFRLLDGLDEPPPHLDPAFFDQAADRAAAAVGEAIGKLEPFDRVGTGQARVERVASSRRVKGDDGTILIRWSACRDPDLRAMPDGVIDPYVKTITFARGDRPLARLHYYATHPQSFYGDPRASYDFPGIAREGMEAEEKVFQVYFTGCAGDVTAGKYNDGSPEARAELAARLLDGMRRSAASTRYVPAQGITWRTVPLELEPRSDSGYTEADYRKRMNNASANPAKRIYSGAMPLAFLARRSRPIELSSLSIGDVHVLHLPGESMVEFQLHAQGLVHDGFVAVAAYGDCGCGYICTEAAFAEGGYEPTDSLVVPESEAALKRAIRELLGVK